MGSDVNSNTALVLKARGSVAVNLASIAAGAELVTDVTCTGAELGDIAFCSYDVDVTDLVMTCNVTAANVVSVSMANLTVGAIDIGSATSKLRVGVIDAQMFG